MVIKFIKKLAGRVVASDNDSKADRSKTTSGPEGQGGRKSSAATGDRRRGGARQTGGRRKAQARGSGSGAEGKSEVWRPGQHGASGEKGESRAQRSSGGRGSKNGDGHRRGGGGRRRRPRKSDAVLSQPESSDGITAAEGRVAPEQSSWKEADFEVNAVEGKVRFHDLGFPPEIMHALADLDFKYCTPIQAGVLRNISEGANIAGRAQTGTGKTAAFLLLTYTHFLKHPPEGKRVKGRPRALVLAPTRELVIQIVRDADALAKYTKFRNLAIYGGTGYEQQERQLAERPVDLIAATPGRLLDFYNKRKIDLRGVDVLVIDEADRMLDMGFIPDVRRIIRATPPKEKRRTLLFSATLSDDVMRLARQWMPDPQMVEIEPEHVAVDTVKQLVYLVKATEKFTVLYNLLKRPNIGRVLIFANRRDQTERIAHELKRYGIPCEVLSGAVSQNRRMRVLEDFRAGKIKTVVATDVAGRGLHVEGINHVVNFDLPYEAEDYVHRIGRTGRAGASGTAVSFACEDESFTIPEIEKYIGDELKCQYPEEVLTRPLPRPRGEAYRRRPPTRGGGQRRSGGARRSGGNRSGRPQGGSRRG